MSESADEAFNEATVIEPSIDRSFFAGLPAIVTGAGLLITFMAILVALLDVRIEDNRVQGIENLIQGLSGKFISSLAALAAATLYLLLEKPLFHRLGASRQRLVAVLDTLVPRLSMTRLLIDVQRGMTEYAASLRQSHADLPDRLQQALGASMAPTLQRLVAMLAEVSQVLRELDSHPQDTLVDALGELLARLEHSLSATLGEIGAQFKESLAGSAQQEFAQMIGALSGATGLLEGMNAQFQATQAVLNELVTFARQATEEQAALGRSQVEELTALLRGLMTQLNEAAGLSVTNMTDALTAVVHDLSTRVSELGQQMASTVVSSAQQATGAANDVITHASTWSAQQTEQLAELLERHQVHLGQVEETRSTLDTTLSRFREALGQYTAVTADLRRIATEMNGAASAAATATKSMTEAGETVQRVVSLTEKQVERLAESLREQDATWQTMHGNLRQYQQVFGQVENTASHLFMQIDQNLRQYREVVRQGFEEVIKLADEHFKSAAQHLGGSVGELDDTLQHLTEILEQVRHSGDSDDRHRE